MYIQLHCGFFRKGGETKNVTKDSNEEVVP